MFGGSLDPPKHHKHKKPKPMTYDVQLPTACWPGVYGHMGRQPNTDYHIQLLHYKQRTVDAHNQLLATERKRLMKEITVAKYDKHTEHKVLQRHIQEKFEEKVKAYEESIEERREKLRELLCAEEQEFIRETIELAQKGVENKMQEMKIKAEKLKAQREAERLELVNKQRMRQLIECSQSLRPFMVKKNLLECKQTQLQQIRENQMKKEAERELDNMWNQLIQKQTEAMTEREIQDMLKKDKAMQETLDVWEKQIEGKRLLMAEKERVAAEDRIEMQKQMEQLKKEEETALEEKKKKRDLIDTELKQQVALQERYAAERKKSEDALNEAFRRMAVEEMKREKEKIKDTTSQAKRETAIYRAHLKQLTEERKQEEKQLNKLLAEHQKMVDQQKQEAYCKVKAAKDKLMRDVLEGRAQQLDYKRQQEENQRKLQEDEKKLLKLITETNEKLQMEHDRLQAEAERLYREDLKKQIEENSENKKQERDELRQEFAERIAEEERHRRRILDIFEARLASSEFKHPFKLVLERTECPCPKNQID